MEVSRLKVSEELRHQKSTQTKILLWMQQHPNKCKHTNISKLARSIDTVDIDFCGKQKAITRMVNKLMLERFGTKFNSTFIINYFHKDISPEVLANADEEVRNRIESVKREAAAQQQEITKEGVRITKPKAPKEEPQEQPIKAEATQQGQQITITININLKDLNNVQER